MSKRRLASQPPRGWTVLALLFSFIVLPCAAAGCAQEQASSQELTAAPTPTAVPSGRRLLLTYYFYWYDSVTGGHLQEGSGLRHRLPPAPAPTWRSVAWHKKELADMAWAGIDVVLPVYWGSHKPEDEWSWKGLEVMARAWQELARDGGAPPHVGMFFDTTIIEHRDLTTPAGKAFFYQNIKDFFSIIPREQWATINDGPIVFLFTSDWTAAVDQSTFDYVYEQFQHDFDVRPYIVREVSWDYPILRWENGERVRDASRPIRTENSYLWDAAYHGYIDRGGVAVVGPGYDDRLVPGRGRGRVRDREDGAFYRRAFEQAIASGKDLLVIETWNEIHEGSGISETVEFGRKYIELTRELAAQFHQRPQ